MCVFERKGVTIARKQICVRCEERGDQMLQTLINKIVKPKPTGVSCIRCGWNGPIEKLVKAPRLNENGATYQIDACPNCYRNGGLVYH
jgi:hypothetical protein